MAKHTLNRLTARQVDTVKLGERLPDGGGLYLDARKSRPGKWVLRKVIGAEEKFIGLGGARDVSLAEARKAAASIREKIARGEHPRAASQKQAVSTFGEAADAYVATHR